MAKNETVEGVEASAPSLSELVSRVGEGDREAFADLYDRTSPKLYGLALRTLRSASLAEESVQETYLQVWERAHNYDASKGQALTWMLTICHRRSVDRVRSEEARKERENRYSTGETMTMVGDLSEEVCSRVQADGLMNLLSDLPPKQCEALSLVYFEGMTAHEAATALSIPVPTMKSRLRDGLQTLRKQIRRQDNV